MGNYNTLGFWDHIKIAFYTKFRSSAVSQVGSAFAVLYSLPNGKTFFQQSPKTQEVRPATGPLPMPSGSVIPSRFDVPDIWENTSADFALDDEFEDAIAKRDSEELASQYAEEALEGIPQSQEDAVRADLLRACEEYVKTANPQRSQ
jgi:hypothetical protein